MVIKLLKTEANSKNTVRAASHKANTDTATSLLTLYSKHSTHPQKSCCSLLEQQLTRG